MTAGPPGIAGGPDGRGGDPGTAGYIETFRSMVYPWHCDHQGHMNTMHYVGMFDTAFWHHLSALGFTRAYMEERRTGFFDVKDTIEYRAELAPGSLVAIDSALLRIGATSVVARHRMWNTETRTMAATSEKVTVYSSLDTRRKTPLPEDLRAAMEANLVERGP